MMNSYKLETIEEKNGMTAEEVTQLPPNIDLMWLARKKSSISYQ
jgi:hypothetical protein